MCLKACTPILGSMARQPICLKMPKWENWLWIWDKDSASCSPSAWLHFWPNWLLINIRKHFIWTVKNINDNFITIKECFWMCTWLLSIIHKAADFDDIKYDDKYFLCEFSLITCSSPSLLVQFFLLLLLKNKKGKGYCFKGLYKQMQQKIRVI